MKKVIKLALVVAMVVASSSLFAQKLGRINLQELITAMPEYAQMQTNMTAAIVQEIITMPLLGLKG